MSVCEPACGGFACAMNWFACGVSIGTNMSSSSSSSSSGGSVPGSRSIDGGILWRRPYLYNLLGGVIGKYETASLTRTRIPAVPRHPNGDLE